MAKKIINDDLKLQAFPEEITEEGLKVYGETSYENQMAVLSQFLHNGGIQGDDIEARGRREEISPQTSPSSTSSQAWEASD